MGFSISGATVVIVLGLFIGFGMFYSAAGESVNRIVESNTGMADQLLDQQNTAVNLQSATYWTTNSTVTISVTNTGSTTLALDETSVLLDGRIHSVTNATVENETETTLWLPGETAIYKITNVVEAPTRALIVTEHGISGQTTDIEVS